METAWQACHIELMSLVDETPLNGAHPDVQAALARAQTVCAAFIAAIQGAAQAGQATNLLVAEIRIAQAHVGRYVQGGARGSDVYGVQDMITLCLSRAIAGGVAASQGQLPA